MGLATIIKKDTTSYMLEVAIRSSATGQLLAGLAAADMTIEYQRQGAAAHVSVTPVAGTLGTWASGSWVEGVPGIYQFGIPNAALAAGADSVVIVFTSAESQDADISIYLTASELIGIGESVSVSCILTSAEAAAILRVAEDDQDMLALLPLVDEYIERSTGRDWAADSVVDNGAKAAARMLLVQWFENPAMQASGIASLEFGLNAVLTQLEARALQLETTGVPAEALAITSSMPSDGEADVAIGVAPVLVFNHQMHADAPEAVALADADGTAVVITAALDVTGKILTITPTSDLTAAAVYTLTLTAIPDIYGQTLTTTREFQTAP
ncbi:hypothetical protein D4S03_09160 [bacterium]|nr:MAG: hypothetical protein D4S03_09160 [bacterium]